MNQEYSSVALYFFPFFQVVDDDGNLELYPIVFKAFKHSTLPPSKQTKSGPWNSFLEIIGYIRGPNEASTGAGSGLPGDSVQPIPPRRVLSYTASFDKNTTVQQVIDNTLSTCTYSSTQFNDISIMYMYMYSSFWYYSITYTWQKQLKFTYFTFFLSISDV